MHLNSILIYARDVEASAAFYHRHFGFEIIRHPGDRITELVSAGGGASLMIHAAGKAQKMGQSTVKLVFAVEDVDAFRDRCAGQGLDFGPVHQADGYRFANGRDPDRNPISVSSRAFRPAEKYE